MTDRPVPRPGPPGLPGARPPMPSPTPGAPAERPSPRPSFPGASFPGASTTGPAQPSPATPAPGPVRPAEPTPVPPVADQPTLEAAGPDGPTGHATVDRALSLLDDLDHLPVEEHAERLAAAHEQLHAALDEHRSRD